MVQLKILSGKKAGTVWVARRFPVRIGRAADADLRLEEEGVWDQHLRLEFRKPDGFILAAQPQALASVNGQALTEVPLRNGDQIELGALKLQFWLTEAGQYSLRPRESLTWLGIAFMLAGQVALIYWLLR